MKKISISLESPKPCQGAQRLTIGMDLGDRTSRYCLLNEDGQVLRESSVATTKKAMAQAFARLARCRVAVEVGTHSPWVSRLLKSLGHEVIVANPRQVKLMVVRVRAALVDGRTALVNAARGLAKAIGERLPGCDTDQMGVERMKSLPAGVQEKLRPLLEEVASLTEKIHVADKQIEQIARTEYPETTQLQQVCGVGALIALTFVLTIEDRKRFQKSRDVGCYVGLRPKRSSSGESEPQLRITKEGDVYLRKLLVQGAHCILSLRGPDTDLKRWGLKLCERGGQNAKKRALVAVARKLSILLHRLWVTGEVYEPLRISQAGRAAKKVA